jgi:hypothetical protein
MAGNQNCFEVQLFRLNDALVDGLGCADSKANLHRRQWERAQLLGLVQPLVLAQPRVLAPLWVPVPLWVWVLQSGPAVAVQRALKPLVLQAIQVSVRIPRHLEAHPRPRWGEEGHRERVQQWRSVSVEEREQASRVQPV